MNNNFKLLNDWLLTTNLKDEKVPILKDIHIDELIGQKDNKTMFFRSLELFYDFIHLNFGCDLHTNYIPALIFSLSYSKKISFKIKKNIWNDFDITTPNIYLIPKASFFVVEEVEEYKKPLNIEVFKQFQEDCVIYYRCFRTLEDIQNNWEYARAIYIENFGKKKT